jgi:hypothetical protein
MLMRTEKPASPDDGCVKLGEFGLGFEIVGAAAQRATEGALECTVARSRLRCSPKAIAARIEALWEAARRSCARACAGSSGEGARLGGAIEWHDIGRRCSTWNTHGDPMQSLALASAKRSSTAPNRYVLRTEGLAAAGRCATALPER